MKRKVNHAISYNEPLLCIAFRLPGFSLSDLSISNEFTKPVDFSLSQFLGDADFSKTNFQGGAFFSECNFPIAGYFYSSSFYNSEFHDKTYFSGYFGSISFNYVLFDRKEKVIFDVENLSYVTFMNTDITGDKFRDKQDEEEEEKERRLKRVNTDISTQLKDELQVTTLVLIYELLLPLLLFCLLERAGGLLLSLLADYKDLDVDNNLVRWQAYLLQPQSG